MNEMNCRYPVIDIIEDAMEKGEIIKMDPNQIIITVLGSCLFYFMGENIIRTVLLTEKSFDRNEFLEQRKEAIFKIIYYGISPR